MSTDHFPESVAPRHRRCVKPKHHVWVFRTRTLTGFSVFDCVACGEVELG